MKPGRSSARFGCPHGATAIDPGKEQQTLPPGDGGWGPLESLAVRDWSQVRGRDVSHLFRRKESVSSSLPPFNR